MRDLQIFLVLHFFLFYHCDCDESLLAEIASKLPKPLRFWPLVKQFGANDISNNGQHGIFHSFSIKPYKNNDSSHKTAYVVGRDERGYIELKGINGTIEGAGKSLTVAMVVGEMESIENVPILQFGNDGDGDGLKLQLSISRGIFLAVDNSEGGGALIPCDFKEWVFVGFIYSQLSRTLSTFCKTINNDGGIHFGPPLQAQNIPGLLANSFTVGKASPGPFAVTNLVVYQEALREKELKLVSQLYQKISTDSCDLKSCLPESCRLIDDEAYKFDCVKKLQPVSTTNIEIEQVGGSNLSIPGWLYWAVSTASGLLAQLTVIFLVFTC